MYGLTIGSDSMSGYDIATNFVYGMAAHLQYHEHNFVAITLFEKEKNYTFNSLDL